MTMATTKRFLVTGGAGFIGSALVRHLIEVTQHEVAVFDKLTYAGNLQSLAPVAKDRRYRFIRGDVANAAEINAAILAVEPDIVIHLAAESHVDRSIDAPADFVRTNIVGTYTLLECALGYWRRLSPGKRQGFRLHHVSTDEVFGALGAEGAFTENSAYRPTSPYAASKAASDHLVRAWHHTHGLPIVVSNCSNNYGPYQFPEKLIPLMILNCLEGKSLPVYGRGSNVRDWLFVEDHARALRLIAEQGHVGETYAIGGLCERTNIEVVRNICASMDEILSVETGSPRESLIEFVTDRPGHDLRYAIDPSKVRAEFGWSPQTSFESGLAQTIRWYLANRPWWEAIRSGIYGGERLGQAL